jgi:hypothetical protein
MFRPKVQHPHMNLVQMKSDGFQRQHYFGGSQVPISLMPAIPFSGKGIRNHIIYNPSHKGIQKI